MSVLLFARLDAWAQSKYVVLNSAHQYSVPNIITTHNYRWKIFDDTGKQLKFKLVEDDIYVVDSEGDLDYIEGTPVRIKWKEVDLGKKYQLVLTEENANTGCSVDSELDVVIINQLLSIKFNKENEYKCADEGNAGFVIPLSVESIDTDPVVGSDISGSFPITIEFYMKYCDGIEEKKTMVLENESDLLYLYEVERPDFVEDQSKDHLFTFRFKSAKDKYGADIEFDDKTSFAFGAYKKPIITDIMTQEATDLTTHVVAVGTEMTYGLDVEDASGLTFHWTLRDADGAVVEGFDYMGPESSWKIDYTDIKTGDYKLSVYATNHPPYNCGSEFVEINIKVIAQPLVKIVSDEKSGYCSFTKKSENIDEFAFDVAIEGYLGSWTLKYSILDPEGNLLEIGGETEQSVHVVDSKTVNILLYLDDKFVNNKTEEVFYTVVIDEVVLEGKGSTPEIVDEKKRVKVGILPAVKIGAISSGKIEE